MKILCTICARGGSEGVKNKNIREICGKPLIAHSILQAKQTGLFEVVAVSSDSPAILAAAKTWGADFLIERPAELATSAAAKLPAIRHAVKSVEQHYQTQYEISVDLDATSPLRKMEDIIDAVNLLKEKKVDNIITVSPARRSPYFNLVELDHNGYAQLSKNLVDPVLRRQDSPRCYDINGSVYVWWRDILLSNDSLFTGKTAIHIMPEERSIDIDTELDFQIVKLLASQRQEFNSQLPAHAIN